MKRACIAVVDAARARTIRKYNGVLHRADLRTDEIAHDLVNASPAQLHDQLAALDIVPPRQRLEIAR